MSKNTQKIDRMLANRSVQFYALPVQQIIGARRLAARRGEDAWTRDAKQKGQRGIMEGR